MLISVLMCWCVGDLLCPGGVGLVHAGVPRHRARTAPPGEKKPAWATPERSRPRRLTPHRASRPYRVALRSVLRRYLCRGEALQALNSSLATFIIRKGARKTRGCIRQLFML